MTIPSFPLRCALLTLLLLVQACTTIRVEPLATQSPPIRHVCIEENPKVIVRDFVRILRGCFSKHGIGTEMFSGPTPPHCEFVVTYTALQSWDIVRYLVHAEVRMASDGRTVASGTFHLVGGGGYALTKYRSTQSKMEQLMDEMLASYY